MTPQSISPLDMKKLQSLLSSGVGHIRNNRITNAKQSADELLKLFPEASDSHGFMSLVLRTQGKFSDALVHIDEAYRLAPENVNILLDKAFLHNQLRQTAKVCEYAKLAAKFSNDNASILLAVSELLGMSGDHEGVKECLSPIVNNKCEDIKLLLKMAQTHFYLGDMAAANTVIDQILTIRPNFGDALLLKSRLKTHSIEDNNIKSLVSILDKNTSNWPDEMLARFALSKEYEDINDYKKSFEQLEGAVGLRRKNIQYDSKLETQKLQELIDFYTPENIQKVSINGASDKSPIFILGLPRSGTTLVERILTNTKNVGTIGEASDFILLMSQMINDYQNKHQVSSLDASLHVDFKKLGQQYIGTADHAMQSNSHFIDKLPFNFLYLALIKKALPNAKIIHLVRNPMDSCYAIYKTLFNKAYFFSYTQEEMAEYYIAYRRLMTHWHSLFPNEILDVQYESLVQNPEQQALKIFNYCGIEYDAEAIKVEKNEKSSSTASAAQIREPIYTGSVDKWRNYEEQLSPLFNRLKASGLVD